MEANHTLIGIRNNLDVQRAVQTVLSDANKSRPPNTRKNYEPRQREWIAWCTRRQFQDGSIVTEGKFVLFLEEVVESRGDRTMNSGITGRLSVEGMAGYVKAMVDLWCTQQALDLSLSHRHPRGTSLRSFLALRKGRFEQQKRESYQKDRGARTVQDTYNSEEMLRISSYFMQQANARGIRDRLDYLLGHALIARGEITRYISCPTCSSWQ